MPFQTGQVSVGTTATLIVDVGQGVPDNDGVIVSASAACFVGGPSVTPTTGFALAASTPVRIPTTGAASEPLYGITSSGTALVSYIFPG
jgi:hypothetical protein